MFISSPFLFVFYQLISFLLIAVGTKQSQTKAPTDFGKTSSGGPRAASKLLLFSGFQRRINIVDPD